MRLTRRDYTLYHHVLLCSACTQPSLLPLHSRLIGMAVAIAVIAIETSFLRKWGLIPTPPPVGQAVSFPTPFRRRRARRHVLLQASLPDHGRAAGQIRSAGNYRAAMTLPVRRRVAARLTLIASGRHDDKSLRADSAERRDGIGRANAVDCSLRGPTNAICRACRRRRPFGIYHPDSDVRNRLQFHTSDLSRISPAVQTTRFWKEATVARRSAYDRHFFGRSRH